MPGVATIHDLYGVRIGLGSPVVIGGVRATNVDPQPEIRAEESDGQPYPEFMSLVAQNPRATFSTVSLKAALDQLGTRGLAVNATDVPTGVDFFAHKHAEGGDRAGASSHRQYRMTEGLLLPVSISVEGNGDASLDAEAVITWDGTNDPIAITENVSLPTASDDARWGMGPVKIANVVLNQKTSVSIAFGLEVVAEFADGEIWPRFAHTKRTRVVITVTGNDIAWLSASNIPLKGKAGIHTDTEVYLRKRALGADFVLDNVAEHIKFTADGMAVVSPVYDGSGSGEPVGATVRLEARWDRTNDPLTRNTAIKIT